MHTTLPYLNAKSEPFRDVVRSYLRDMDSISPNVEKVLNDVEQNRFFPKNSLNCLMDHGIFDVHFLRLLYLCFHLDRAHREGIEDLDFSPFMVVQRKSMKLAKKWERITAIGLHPLFAGSWFLFWLVILYIGYISIIPTLPLPANLSIVISVSIISGMGLAFTGLVLTGTFPDLASRTANEAQNHTRALQTSYRYMSQRLLELYAHHETQSLAEEIAAIFNKVNRQKLKNTMLRLMDNSDTGELLRSLKEVHIFVREGTRNTALLNPDLTTHWLTLESNALINPPRAVDFQSLFHDYKQKDRSDESVNSNTLTSTFTNLDLDDRSL